MIIFTFLKQHFRNRKTWLLMSLITCTIEITAFWIQYSIDLKPCLFCIYERYILFEIIGASFIGAIAPKTPLRYVAIFIWLYSTWKGINLTWNHIMMQSNTSSFLTCDFPIYFPNWISLEKWFPKIFINSRECSTHQLKFLTFKIQEWLAGIFIFYFIIALLVLFSEFYKSKKENH